MWWSWGALALGWTDRPHRTVPLPDAPTHLVAGSFDGRSVLVVATPTAVQILDPTGGILATATATDFPALAEVRHLTLVDVRQRGSAEILTCGPTGIHLLAGGLAGFDAAVPLADGDCVTLAVGHDRGVAELVSTGPAGLIRWVSSVDGLAPDEIAPAGEEISVTRAGQSVAWGIGADLGGTDRSSADPQDGPIADLVGLPSGEIAMLVDGASPQVILGGARWPVSTTAGLRLVAGTDTPRSPSFFLLDAPHRRIGYPDDDALVWIDVDVAPHAGAVMDAETGCPDLFVLGEGGGALQIPGRCGDGSPDVPRVAPVGPNYVVRDLWGSLDAQVGTPLVVQLVDARGAARRWRAEGGPPSFTVGRMGEIAWTPQADDVGTWRVSLRLVGGLGRYDGVLLRVFPPATVHDVGVAPGPVSETLPPRTDRGYAWVPRDCVVGLGLVAGVSAVPATEDEGATRRVSGSPWGGITCAGGPGRIAWFVGADTAPFYRYPSGQIDRVHALGGLLGLQFGASPRLSVGVYGAAGFDARGVGLRGIWLARPRSGAEIRLLWSAPDPSGQLALAWVSRL